MCRVCVVKWQEWWIHPVSTILGQPWGWTAILAHDLASFASAYKASFEAQVAMFPGMVSPTYIEHPEEDGTYIANAIAHYSAMDDVLAWKMPGAGGGGYLALVVKDAKAFTESHPEAFEIKIRRE